MGRKSQESQNVTGSLFFSSELTRNKWVRLVNINKAKGATTPIGSIPHSDLHSRVLLFESGGCQMQNPGLNYLLCHVIFCFHESSPSDHPVLTHDLNSLWCHITLYSKLPWVPGTIQYSSMIWTPCGATLHCTLHSHEFQGPSKYWQAAQFTAVVTSDPVTRFHIINEIKTKVACMENMAHRFYCIYLEKTKIN